MHINRPHSQHFEFAIGSFEEEGTYVWGDFNGKSMSSVNGGRLQKAAEYRVLMRSLQSILDEIGIFHVNFFSLDVEGYEMNVLMGIDFKKTQFDYLLIEIYAWQYEEIVSFLSGKGYEMIESFSNYNLITNPGWDGTHNDYLFKRKGYTQTT